MAGGSTPLSAQRKTSVPSTPQTAVPASKPTVEKKGKKVSESPSATTPTQDNASYQVTKGFVATARIPTSLKPVGAEAGETVKRSGAANRDTSKADAAHKAITTDLFNGRAIDAHPFSANQNRGNLLWVKVYNPNTDGVREALFKAREYGDRDGWSRPPLEFVAYDLNRMLGMDYVPPVAYRHHFDANFQHHEEGSITYMVPDCHKLCKVDESQWGIRKDLFLSDTRIFDVLMLNCDRHPGNFGRGKHWVDGKYRPLLLDHDACLRHGASVTMEQNDAFGSGAVKVVRKQTLDALKDLNFDRMKRHYHEFLSDGEIKGMLSRRDGIVAYFDRLVAKNGLDKVVIDVNDF